MNLVKCFKTLGDPSRLNLIKILLQSDLCVGALARLLGLSEPALSQHLKLLREAGLVKGEKRGYWTHYSVEKDTLRQIAKQLTEMTDVLQPYETVCWKSALISEISPKRKAKDMCNDCCQKPENLKDKPESCSPEQVEKCHGKDGGHPCVKKEKKKR
jgi:ArsR family transcriptional regulator, arsenate/arsenite/antimonite-responsive transcriptional repressor